MTTKTTEQERSLETYALMELTEANISPVSDSGAWDTEVGFLQRERDDADSGGFDEALETAALLA